MLLLSALLLFPVILGADQEWNFGNYVIKTNENNTLIGIEKTTYESLDELNLSNLGLKNIDSNAFVNVTNIRRLNLANNWLTTLPKYVFSTLIWLEQLSLADNNISSLDGVFIGNNYLWSLDLSNNQIEHIGSSYLYGLGKNVVISTKGNFLKNISALLFVKPYESLEKTILENKSDVTENLTDSPTIDFSTVCTYAYWLIMLQENVYLHDHNSVECTQVRVNHTDLRLSLNYFNISSGNLGRRILNDLPENIVEVDLSHNDIILTDLEIENLYLHTLILDKNRVNNIPDNAFAKTNLSVLSLNYNLLHDTEFANTLPSSLEEIRLSYNKIDMIPIGSFSRLKNLVKLDLSHNFLRYFEANSFRNLGVLRELNLYDNRIYVYKGIFAGLRSIEYLNIGMNHLNETKNILFAMPDTLATVILDSNKIESLEIGSFVRVPKRKLSLKGNNIKRFVQGSFNLPNLEELDLGSNDLTQLHRDSFEGLANLKQLSLAKNKITTLKNYELVLLRKLEILDLSSNPIVQLRCGALANMVKSQSSVVFLSDVPIEMIYRDHY